MKLSTWSHALLGVGAVCAVLAFIPVPLGLDALARGKLAGIGLEGDPVAVVAPQYWG